MERFNSFSSDQIILTKRQASMFMASMLLFCLFVFILGFFLGKRTVIDDFSANVSKEALHDQIDFLLTTQSFESSQEDGLPGNEVDFQNNNDVHISFDAMQQDDIKAPSQEKAFHTPVASSSHENNLAQLAAVTLSATQIEGAKTRQYAQLIGFGTKQAAQAFVARLKKNNVPVVLKTMMSKTAAGKERTWYQAITPTYESEEELHAHVAKIKRLEHIRDKDIKIIFLK